MNRQAGSAIDRRAWPVTRLTAAGGSYNDDGEWVPVAATSSPIKAVVQPVKGNQLMDMPEGIRTEAGWICWSRSGIAVDDKIINNGVTYRVLFVWPRDQDGAFYRAALGKVAA
jgi:hypothetical protein